MSEQYTKQEASEILSQQMADFLSNGGVVTTIKTKKNTYKK